MRFDYAAIISFSADTGEPVAVFRPEVQIRILGPNGSKDFDALVDTGSDTTVLPGPVAHSLGIPLVRCTGPAAQVFGGKEIELSYADVELELVHSLGTIRWMARAYFSTGGTDEETVLLGHQGFLEYFTATFSGEECVLDLEPNSYLPRIAGTE